jgi:hypothetical protein
MKKLFLFVSVLLSGWFAGVYSQNCANLFFSEYVEGSNNDKALEIYNPTANPINLDGYFIARYSNGSQVMVDSLTLKGVIAPYDVAVVVNGQEDSLWVSTYWSLPVSEGLLALGDIFDKVYPAVSYFNGDDAITLEKIDGTILDIFGKVGEDPGQGWTDQEVNNFLDVGDYWNIWTKDLSLIRKPTVKQGVSANPSLFNVTLEWDSLPKNTWTELGQHVCDCNLNNVQMAQSAEPRVYFFPNPVTGNDLQIKASAIFSKVELVNSLGQVIQAATNNLFRGEMRLNLTDRNPGLHFVRVYFPDGQVSVSKLILQ